MLRGAGVSQNQRVRPLVFFSTVPQMSKSILLVSEGERGSLILRRNFNVLLPEERRFEEAGRSV